MIHLIKWLAGRDHALLKRYLSYTQLRRIVFDSYGDDYKIEYPKISDNSLSIIVGGYEKGGTTLLKDLLSVANLGDCCFECGVLLFPPPVRAQRHLSNIDDALPGFKTSWALSDSFDAKFHSVDNYDDLYKLIKSSAEHFTYKNKPIIDKYPRYMMYLDRVMAHAPETKVLIVLRRPEYVVASWLALGRSIEEAIDAISFSNFGLISAIALHSFNSLFILRHEDLLFQPSLTLNRVGINISNQVVSESISNIEAIGTPSITGGASNVIDLDRDSSAFNGLKPNIQMLILDELASRPEVKVLNRLSSGPVSKINRYLFKHLYYALNDRHSD